MNILSEKQTTALLATVAALAFSAVTAAVTLEGNDASEYTRFCPADSRAVWVETFDTGNLAGYSKLICLNEPLQETSDWWLTPEDTVIPSDELPDFPGPEPYVFHASTLEAFNEPVHPINLNPLARAPLWVTFQIEEPVLPDLGYNYAGSFSSYTGDDGTVVIEAGPFWVEGEEVDQATYEAYENEAREAEREQSLERDLLIHQVAQAKLYDLVDLNDWHDWLSVDDVNAGVATNACWISIDGLLISLSRTEIDRLSTSSAAIVRAENYGVPTNDDGNIDGAVPEVSVESECARYNASDARYGYFFGSGEGASTADETNDALIVYDTITQVADTQAAEVDIISDDGSAANDQSISNGAGALSYWIYLLLLTKLPPNLYRRFQRT